MYDAFYGFKERPFSLLPDPDFLYLDEKHRTALDLLELAIYNQSGFCVISGEIGAGKTTLIRELLNRLDDSVEVGLVSNTHRSFGQVMQWIMAAYGLETGSDDSVELHRRFIDYVIQRYAENKHTLLIIDEAQNLSVPALEELRMLSNVNSEKDLVLQIILVGQTQLRDRLKKPALEQFAQRIAIDYHLTGLDEQETRNYIRHRTAHAGGEPGLFDDQACHAVFGHSRGIPRLINRICDLALVYGYSEQSQTITAELVNAVVKDQRIGSILRAAQNVATVNKRTALRAVEAGSVAASQVEREHGDRAASAVVDNMDAILSAGARRIQRTQSVIEGGEQPGQGDEAPGAKIEAAPAVDHQPEGAGAMTADEINREIKQILVQKTASRRPPLHPQPPQPGTVTHTAAEDAFTASRSDGALESAHKSEPAPRTGVDVQRGAPSSAQEEPAPSAPRNRTVDSALKRGIERLIEEQPQPPRQPEPAPKVRTQVAPRTDVPRTDAGRKHTPRKFAVAALLAGVAILAGTTAWYNREALEFKSLSARFTDWSTGGFSPAVTARDEAKTELAAVQTEREAPVLPVAPEMPASTDVAVAVPALPQLPVPVAPDAADQTGSAAGIEETVFESPVPEKGVAEPVATPPEVLPVRTAADAAAEDEALQREAMRIARLQDESRRLERERRAAEEKLASQRRAREALERKARLERDKIQQARRVVEQVAEERARVTTQLDALTVSDPVPASAVVAITGSQRSVAPKPEAEQPTTSATPESQLSVDSEPAAVSGNANFLANPCNGPTARFMSTCF